MQEREKTKQQLLSEIEILRRRVAELEARQAELQESKAHYRLLAEHVIDVIWVTDLALEPIYVSPSVERLRGYTVEEVMAQRVEETLTPASLEVARAALAEGRASVKSNHRDLAYGRVLVLEFLCKDGSTVWTESKVAFQYDERGRPVIVVGVTRDITERMQAEAAMRRSNAELQARNEELDAFAHTVTHDLKSPLSIIVGYAELLEAGRTTMSDADLQNCVRIIVANGRKMSHLIDALLRLSLVRELEVTVEPLDMERIVGSAQLGVAHLIEMHQAEIVLPATWPMALGCSAWIEEVWLNLLSNALKYGGRPPRVELGAEYLAHAPNTPSMIRFWIRDNGPGLTPEEQAQLFIPFTQIDRIPSQGHGLGLSIVKRIVEKLGGQVGIESEPGQGSVFSFTLLVADARVLARESIVTPS
jgi:PAS domain S-box-containing protein